MTTASSAATAEKTGGWGANFFATLDKTLPEPVAGTGQALDAMAMLPAFQDARRWILRNLGIAPGSSVFEAGCGDGAALSDILDIVGQGGRIAGIDPAEALVDAARAKAARHGTPNTRYEVGGLRSIPFPDGEFDAAFSEKVLIDGVPPKTALGEIVRVTRSGGRVGAIEWLPCFLVNTSCPELQQAFDAICHKALYDCYLSGNLAHHFHAAGLADIKNTAFLAHTDTLPSPAFWRAFIVHQIPMFVHAGLLEAATGQAFLADMEALDSRNAFHASFILQAAVGTR